MRAETAVVTFGVATIAAALLWLVYYITAVFPAVVGQCSSCAINIDDQPPFNWGVGLLIFGIILVFVGVLARGIARRTSTGN
jgi:hypothetical protein